MHFSMHTTVKKERISQKKTSKAAKTHVHTDVSIACTHHFRLAAVLQFSNFVFYHA